MNKKPAIKAKLKYPPTLEAFLKEMNAPLTAPIPNPQNLNDYLRNRELEMKTPVVEPKNFEEWYRTRMLAKQGIFPQENGKVVEPRPTITDEVKKELEAKKEREKRFPPTLDAYLATLKKPQK